MCTQAPQIRKVAALSFKGLACLPIADKARYQQPGLRRHEASSNPALLQQLDASITCC